MEKLFFEYLCQLEKALPALQIEQVVLGQNQGRVGDGCVKDRGLHASLPLPTASGCAELDAAWGFYHFFFCLEPVRCGHGVATSRYEDHLGEPELGGGLFGLRPFEIGCWEGLRGPEP